MTTIPAHILPLRTPDPARRALDQLGVPNDLMLRWGEGG
jgi:hypothetical protein